MATLTTTTTQEQFICLSNVLGESSATSTTVQLFNSCRVVKKDETGKYMLTAIRPHLNGVIVIKERI